MLLGRGNFKTIILYSLYFNPNFKNWVKLKTTKVLINKKSNGLRKSIYKYKCENLKTKFIIKLLDRSNFKTIILYSLYFNPNFINWVKLKTLKVLINNGSYNLRKSIYKYKCENLNIKIIIKLLDRDNFKIIILL